MNIVLISDSKFHFNIVLFFCSLLVLALLLLMISVNYTPKSSASSLSSTSSPELLNFIFVKNIGPSQEENPEGHIFQPEGVDIDSEGNIYVNDISQNRILKFSRNGTFIL